MAKLSIEVDDTGSLVTVAVDGENLGCVQHLMFAADANGPYTLQVTLDGVALDSGVASRSVSLLQKLSYCKMRRVDVITPNNTPEKG